MFVRVKIKIELNGIPDFPEAVLFDPLHALQYLLSCSQGNHLKKKIVISFYKCFIL